MQQKQKAFSLIEAVMSLTLLGVIILMIAPIVASRSIHSTEIQCEDGGQKVCYANDLTSSECRLAIKTGMDRLWITVIPQGGSGNSINDSIAKNILDKSSTYSVGTDAGTTYKTFYYNNGRGIKLKNGDYDEVKVQVAVPVANDKVKINIQFLKNGKSLETTVIETELDAADPFEKVKLASGYPLRAGLPAFCNFLGPLFGVGAYGEYRLTAGIKSNDVPINADVIIFEWSGTCVSTGGVR